MEVSDDKIKERFYGILSIIFGLLDKLAKDPDNINNRLLLAYYEGKRSLLTDLCGPVVEDAPFQDGKLLTFAAQPNLIKEAGFKSPIPPMPILDEATIEAAWNQPTVEV